MPFSASVSAWFGVTPSRTESGTASPGRHHLAHLQSDLLLEFLFADDVDVPADKPRRKTNVLSLLTDRQTQLVFGDDDLHLAFVDIGDSNLRNLCRRKRIRRKHRRLVRPLDDVDLFATQFFDDRLHARTLHTDARSDRIDVLFIRCDRDLCTVTGLPDGRFDHDGIVVDLGNFHLEQSFDAALTKHGNILSAVPFAPW